MPNQSEIIKKNEFDRVLLVEASAEQIKHELAKKPGLKAFVRLPNNVQQMTEVVLRNIRTSAIQSLQAEKAEQIEQLSNSNLDLNFVHTMKQVCRALMPN